MPAFKKNSNGDEVTWVDIHKDLLIMTIDSGDLVIETREGTYILPASLDDWARVLEPYGYEKSDRNCVIKLDQIVDHDEKILLDFLRMFKITYVYLQQSQTQSGRKLNIF